MFCGKCGSNIPNGSYSCPYCSTPVGGSSGGSYGGNSNGSFGGSSGGNTDIFQQQSSGSYSQQFDIPYSGQQYSSYGNSGDVSVGRWIGVFAISLIPVANLVMLFVWAFGSGAMPSLKNYARAVLILALVAIVFWLIAIAIVGCSVSSLY